MEGLDYELIVVDEYQDLNACDLDVLRRIAVRGCNVVAVGDDDQSIYGFRRAHPAGIREFPAQYPGAADYTLSTTIRCGKRIVEWANHVISVDPSRPSQRALMQPLAASPDGDVAHLAFRGNKAEAEGIAMLVKNLRDAEGLAPSDVLILLQSDHNRSYSEPIREELRKLGIESSDPGSVLALFDAPGSRALGALLKLLADGRDSLAWATLVALEPGLNTEDFLDYLYTRATPQGRTVAEELLEARAAGFPRAPGRTGVSAEKLLSEVLPWLEENAPPDTCPEDGWAAWCRDLSAPTRATPAAEFLELLDEVEPYTDERAALPRFLAELQPLARDVAAARGEGVRIMTMMSSKGLTVRATILAGVDDVVMPRKNVDQSEARRRRGLRRRPQAVTPEPHRPSHARPFSTARGNLRHTGPYVVDSAQPPQPPGFSRLLSQSAFRFSSEVLSIGKTSCVLARPISSVRSNPAPRGFRGCSSSSGRRKR